MIWFECALNEKVCVKELKQCLAHSKHLIIAICYSSWHLFISRQSLETGLKGMYFPWISTMTFPVEGTSDFSYSYFSSADSKHHRHMLHKTNQDSPCDGWLANVWLLDYTGYFTETQSALDYFPFLTEVGKTLLGKTQWYVWHNTQILGTTIVHKPSCCALC
jgi:hypothetical protein